MDVHCYLRKVFPYPNAMPVVRKWIRNNVQNLDPALQKRNMIVLHKVPTIGQRCVWLEKRRRLGYQAQVAEACLERGQVHKEIMGVRVIVGDRRAGSAEQIEENQDIDARQRGVLFPALCQVSKIRRGQWGGSD